MLGAATVGWPTSPGSRSFEHSKGAVHLNGTPASFPREARGEIYSDEARQEPRDAHVHAYFLSHKARVISKHDDD